MSCKEESINITLGYVSKSCQNLHVVQQPMSSLQLNSLLHEKKHLPGKHERHDLKSLFPFFQGPTVLLALPQGVFV